MTNRTELNFILSPDIWKSVLQSQPSILTTRHKTSKVYFDTKPPRLGQLNMCLFYYHNYINYNNTGGWILCMNIHTSGEGGLIWEEINDTTQIMSLLNKHLGLDVKEEYGPRHIGQLSISGFDTISYNFSSSSISTPSIKFHFSQWNGYKNDFSTDSDQPGLYAIGTITSDSQHTIEELLNIVKSELLIDYIQPCPSTEVMCTVDICPKFAYIAFSKERVDTALAFRDSGFLLREGQENPFKDTVKFITLNEYIASLEKNSQDSLSDSDLDY